MVSLIEDPANSDELASLTDQAFLQGIGSRARVLRERRGMTRKALAREADVSERYLAQLESGEGNMSIVLLRRVATALGSRLVHMLEPDEAGSVVLHPLFLLAPRSLDHAKPQRGSGCLSSARKPRRFNKTPLFNRRRWTSFPGMRLRCEGCCPASDLPSGDRDRGLLGERRMGRPCFG